jgi:hypothetical protein
MQHIPGTPLTGGQRASSNPNTARITAERLQYLARCLGRCGDIHPLTGHVCITQPHEPEIEHMAVQIGGPQDGMVYATWGGTRPNDALPFKGRKAKGKA